MIIGSPKVDTGWHLVKMIITYWGGLEFMEISYQDMVVGNYLGEIGCY